MSNDTNKIERIREAVEKLVPVYRNSEYTLADFAALVLDICHEDDERALQALATAYAEDCYRCGGTGMATDRSTGEVHTCDDCPVAEIKAKELTK